jgi:hypothetical protein
MSGAAAQRRLDRLAGEMYAEVNGRSWPIYLTAEDTLSIRVLLDYDSPEWRWLRSMYDRLRDAVLSDGARWAVVVLPLAYQMDPEYPYLPQEQMRRFCEERDLVCVDALGWLRRHSSEVPFLGGQDVWHLSEAGHELVAELLVLELDEAGLLPE